MKVVTYSSVRIEGTETNKGNYAWLSTVNVAFGYGAAVYFHPEFHHVVIAKDKEGRHALIALPGAEWEDSLEEGWTIVQRLTQAPSQKDGDGQ